MHVVFRESHGLEETDTPMDLGQSPGDLVVLSFSDSDLGAFAKAWHRGGGPEGQLPSLRLANLVALRHPLSVDTYVEQTLSGAKGILIRLIGGVPYWSYGLQQVRALAEEKGIALAVLPADGRPDARLDAESTLPQSTLKRLAHLCDTGGEVAAQAALAQMALAAGLYAGPVPGSKSIPEMGAWTPARGVYDSAEIPEKRAQRIILTFYRSYLVAADTAPIEALMSAFEAEGYDVIALYAPSLKAPKAAEWLRGVIAELAPDAIVNATSFSGRGGDGTSPLDIGNVPVFQVALSTARRRDWAESERGLSPSDLAMHVVLPEVDGRIMGGVVSFKEPSKRDPDLEYSRFGHVADAERIDAVVARVNGWLRVAQRPVFERSVALVLSTYPGKDWNLGHAVGLDAPASARAILEDLAEAGYDVSPAPNDLSSALIKRDVRWSLAAYREALGGLPQSLRDDLEEVWGNPESDPVVEDGVFRFSVVQCGKAIIALQPERGGASHVREDEYHDLS
ncbi:MAG: cobaltochelatase subunit CobN, partial [Arenibacterium sp.]